MAVMAPRFSSPRSASADTSQPSKESSAVWEARIPIVSILRPTVKPGNPRSTRKSESPLVPWPGVVEAVSTTKSANGPFVVNILVPLIR